MGLGGFFKNLFGSAKGSIDSIADKASDMAGDAIEMAKDAAAPLMDKVEEYTDMAKEKLSMLKYEKDQLKNYENEIVPAYQKNMEAGLLAYKQNTGSFFVLLDAWDMTLMKQIEYLNKFNDVLKLEAEYEYEIERR